LILGEIRPFAAQLLYVHCPAILAGAEFIKNATLVRRVEAGLLRYAVHAVRIRCATVNRLDSPTTRLGPQIILIPPTASKP